MKLVSTICVLIRNKNSLLGQFFFFFFKKVYEDDQYNKNWIEILGN